MDMAERLLDEIMAANVLIPAQYYDKDPLCGLDRGTRALLVAILKSAINDALDMRVNRARRTQRDDAIRWLEREPALMPADLVCEALGIDRGLLLAGVRARQAEDVGAGDAHRGLSSLYMLMRKIRRTRRRAGYRATISLPALSRESA